MLVWPTIPALVASRTTVSEGRHASMTADGMSPAKAATRTAAPFERDLSELAKRFRVLVDGRQAGSDARRNLLAS